MEEPSPPLKGPSKEEIDAFIRANTEGNKGPTLWNMFNAIGFLVVITGIMFAALFALQQTDNYQKVRDNWKEYRCQPTIMPFAGIYGYDTAENFEFCMKSIFTGFAEEITAPFSSILGIFGTILKTISNTILSIKESVATMGGGINTIFQDFTDRIMNFFFQLRLAAIRIRNLITRMHAIMFAVIYMGTSGIQAGQNFGKTVLFGFLDTFCFPPETTLSVKGKGRIQIHQVQIGDILLPTRSRVTAKFHFAAPGQPMVRLKEGIEVSTNHYLQHGGRWIEAADHPDATPIGPYDRQSLICLNTADHMIPIGPYRFRDYDETSAGDLKTMAYIEERLNNRVSHQLKQSQILENSPSFHPDTQVKLWTGEFTKVKDLTVNTRLSTGNYIGGIFHKEVQEVCQVGPNILGSATLAWDPQQRLWIRVGHQHPIRRYEEPVVFIGLFALTGSQIELASGIRVRDYLELCSPDAEMFYAEQMDSLVYT